MMFVPDALRVSQDARTMRPVMDFVSGDGHSGWTAQSDRGGTCGKQVSTQQRMWASSDGTEYNTYPHKLAHYPWRGLLLLCLWNGCGIDWTKRRDAVAHRTCFAEFLGAWRTVQTTSSSQGEAVRSVYSWTPAEGKIHSDRNFDFYHDHARSMSDANTGAHMERRVPPPTHTYLFKEHMLPLTVSEIDVRNPQMMVEADNSDPL